MRSMAWHRAKGELESMRETFTGIDEDEKFNDLDKTIKEFIEHIEGYELHC